MTYYDGIIVGGGAAGFFAALAAKKSCPAARIAVLEKTAVLLSKVRVSGGGRCNVTHSCFDPVALSKNYPRGQKELIGPFHRFQPKDTVEWFESRGVPLKTETDGRMFPVADTSEAIISCLVNEAKNLGVDILLRQKIEKIAKEDDLFLLTVNGEVSFRAKKVILASGSSLEGHRFAEALGHTIQMPVPSLFTFNVPEFPLKELSGISFEKVKVSISDTSFSYEGPLLITHFGFSGPAVLKLSAWAARYLHEKQYNVDLVIQWVPKTIESILAELRSLKEEKPNRTLVLENPFAFPKNFWKLLLSDLSTKRLNDISLQELRRLAQKLYSDVYKVQGKTTHKEEFVTCGGVSLKEVHFKTMESKCSPGLFFAGEILDIDGITGRV